MSMRIEYRSGDETIVFEVEDGQPGRVLERLVEEGGRPKMPPPRSPSVERIPEAGRLTGRRRS